MKITMLLSAVLLSSSAAMACPFNPNAAYTEVTVPCQGSLPDYSQAYINQRIDNGGECRVEAQANTKFLVVGPNLLLVREEGIQVVGYLQSPEIKCYQTDVGGDYYSTWEAVTLK